ncbi:methyltransferase-like protein 25B [Argopecten irradians]|uniref:methyltransferase-like protein 25B n=1 Tax=Argopecten irradians TaxID=31199 RepID=UPI0037234CE1
MAYRMRLTLKLFYFGDSFRGSAAMNLQSCNEHTVDFLKKQIEKTVKFINEYRWIIDAYVSDFFTDGHWEKLPEGWTAVLSKLEPPDLAFLLDSTLPIPNRKDLPLSLLAFRESTHTLSVDRQKVDLEASQVVDRLFTADSDRELKTIVSPDSGIKVQTQAKADIKYGQYLPLNSCFRANVKPKKQHEILQLGKVLYISLDNLNVKLGKCFRLNYYLKLLGYLKAQVTYSNCHLSIVVCIPSVFCLESLADEKSNSTPGLTTCNKSKHFPGDISRSTVSNNNNNQPSCPVDLSRFVLAGLHACGDLTPTMLRIFTECSHIVGLASVACCYMKLSCDEQGQGKTEDFEVGYPMSCFTKNIADSHLSFEAREMACHFADSYQERLIANSPNLKLHCYRAALQYIIKQTHPEFNHGSIRLTLKRAEELPFESYVQHSLEKIGSGSDVQALVMQQAHSYLPYWQNVVAFYTLRLSLAPVVESLILLDRMMYLYEHGIPSALMPIFDPALSPRNFVLLASKNKTDNF